MQEQISSLISKAAELHGQLERERAAANAHLDRLAAISAGVGRAQQQPQPQLPEVCGPCSTPERSQGQAQFMSGDTFQASTLKLQGQQCNRWYADPVRPRIRAELCYKCCAAACAAHGGAHGSVCDTGGACRGQRKMGAPRHSQKRRP